jgi:hypothetical protein
MGAAFAQVAESCGLGVEVISLTRREWALLDHVSEITGLPYCEIIRQLFEAHLQGEGYNPAIGSLSYTESNTRRLRRIAGKNGG